jgi:hypothetical protein
MLIRTKLLAVLLVLLGSIGIPSFAQAGDPPADASRLVAEFPSLEELESHLGSQVERAGNDPAARPLPATSQGSPIPAFPVSARWFTGPKFEFVSSPTGSQHRPQTAAGPLAGLLSNLDAAQRDAIALDSEIRRQNQIPINKYFFDCLSGYARTDYGTEITGLFANGIGFGTFQQSFRQNYVATYSLPLLQRFSKSTGWTRALAGWSFSSSVGVEPQLDTPIQLQQFLNNLHLSWSVAFSYNFSGATIRKVVDGQLAQEEELARAGGRAAAAREELLRKMAARVNALASNPPVRDTRLMSLRELYPQFELYQMRYQQAQSCEERMEQFFTMKGLALSLLTLAGYDLPSSGGSDLLSVWKKVRYSGCANSL